MEIKKKKDENYKIKPYDNREYLKLVSFLEKCLPESGRKLDLDGHHRLYKNIKESYDWFWCMYDRDDIIGVVALRSMNLKQCELKSLYLLEKYHGMGLGYRLLNTALIKAKEAGYDQIYLDTLSTSQKAFSLYERAGFVRTAKYNDNNRADIFMCMSIIES